jgi:hypothetical protein
MTARWIIEEFSGSLDWQMFFPRKSAAADVTDVIRRDNQLVNELPFEVGAQLDDSRLFQQTAQFRRKDPACHPAEEQ